MVLVRWLIDLRSRYGYHGTRLLGSYWMTGALREDETSVITRVRNIGLTQLPYVMYLSFQMPLCWWVFMVS